MRFANLIVLIMLSPTACAPVMQRQVVNPPGISPLVPAYSVAIRQGNMVFVSGMTGIKPGTQDIIDVDVAVQTRQALENVRTSKTGWFTSSDRTTSRSGDASNAGSAFIVSTSSDIFVRSP